MKRYIIGIWGLWDWLYYHCNRMEYISKGENIFRIVHKKYKGPALQINSGTWLRTGDMIIKLHLHNYHLAKICTGYTSEVHLALYLRRMIKDSLEGLSCYLQKEPNHEQIKAVMGTSMLNRGAERFGFTTYDVPPTLFYKIKAWLYKFIYLLVHPQGIDYLREHGQRLRSKHLIISLEELFERYQWKERP